MTSLTTRDGRRLSYRRFGEGPLVIGHPGGPGFGSGSLRDLGGLDAHHELVLLDPRGTGGSDPANDDTYELDGYVADMEDLVDHLGVQPHALLGHSHGGLVSLQYIAEGHGDVDRVVLMDTPTHLDEELIEQLGSLSEADREESDSHHGASKPARPRPLLQTSIWGERNASFEHALGEEDVSPPALRYFNDHVMRAFDMRPLLSRVDVPALVLCGRDDVAAGPEASATLAEALPDGRLAIIEGAAHVPYIENPSAFLDAVLDFMAA